MSALTSRWAYAAFGAFEVGDAVASAIPIPYVVRQMDSLGVPPRVRPLVPVAKGLASLGLLSVFRFPRLARLTTAMLTLYFAGAVAVHIRVRNKAANVIPSVALLGAFAAMTMKGPESA
ncbi:MAG TPA: DoxX family protein [Mycobacterium sp.]